MLLAFRALHRSPLRRSFSLAGGFTYPAPRRLDDVLKLDLLRRESKEKIEAIWNEFYITKEFNIASAWDSKEFEDFKAASKKNGGLFIFPVKRPGGHFIVISQVQEKSILYTYLEDYKQNPAGATPYLVVTMYDELSSDSDIVLVRGDITPLALDQSESRQLLDLTKTFYLERANDVAAFNKGNFNFEKHISDLLKG